MLKILPVDQTRATNFSSLNVLVHLTLLFEAWNIRASSKLATNLEELIRLVVNLSQLGVTCAGASRIRSPSLTVSRVDNAMTLAR